MMNYNEVLVYLRRTDFDLISLFFVIITTQTNASLFQADIEIFILQ